MKRLAPRALKLALKLAPEIAGTLLAVAVLLSARSALADHYHVPSGSMMPSVEIGDRVLVDKRAYGLRVPFSDAHLLGNGAPQPGDVVVLESPETGVILLKRVVAVPGQVVEVRRGRILIDGQAQPVYRTSDGLAEELGDHAHALRLDYGGGPRFGPRTVPTDRYLVIGDNRGNSHDGRMFGFVEGDAVRGRVMGIYWSDGRPTWRGL